MNILDKLVEKLGGWDNLNSEEQALYLDHIKVIEGKAITVDDTKDFVRRMITIIEKLLVDTPEKSRESMNLKARLKNFLLLEDFLYSADRAKQSLEKFYSTNPKL